jgi:hypothetical protein
MRSDTPHAKLVTLTLIKLGESKMKNNARFYGIELLLLVIVSMALVVTSRAQSTDMDSPTAMTTNVITGEGDGKGESLYYGFTATPGDLKMTVDAKTDKYSTPLDVALLTPDGKELLTVTVVAGDKMERKTGTKHFVREQNVILRISTREDKEVKLLTYKVRLDGSIKIEATGAVSSICFGSEPERLRR